MSIKFNSSKISIVLMPQLLPKPEFLISITFIFFVVFVSLSCQKSSQENKSAIRAIYPIASLRQNAQMSSGEIGEKPLVSQAPWQIKSSAPHVPIKSILPQAQQIQSKPHFETPIQSSRKVADITSTYVNSVRYHSDKHMAEQVALNQYNVAKNHFKIDRNLTQYTHEFPGLRAMLNSLGHESRILDAGAGQGMAAIELLSEYYGEKGELKSGRPPPHVTLMGINKPKESGWFEEVHPLANALKDGKYRYIEGDFASFAEEAYHKELNKNGGYDVITDFYGAYSYTPQIDKVLNNMLRLLRLNGALFIRADSLSNTVRTKHGARFVADWLKVEFKKHAKLISFSTHANDDVMVIRRIAEGNVILPELELVSFMALQPPVREYVVK